MGNTYINRLAVILMFLFCLSACRESLNPQEYTKRMIHTEKGPITTKENKGFTYELQYRFPKYEALISLSNEVVNQEALAAREEIFGTDHKFKLRVYPSDKKENVLKKGTRGQEGYYERIQYFSSAVKEDFALVTNTDTLYALQASLERSYGMAPYIDLLVSFKKEEKQKLKTLIFLDRALSKEKLEFDIEEISNETNYPKLKI